MATATTERDVDYLTGRPRQLIRNSLMARFGAFLKPGESIEVQGEMSDEYVFAQIAVEAADDSFLLEVEAAILAADQGAETLGGVDEHLELALEFLKRQLYDYFRQDREERFHIDWRKYPVEKAIIRFKGQITRPALEREADEMLEAQSQPGLDPRDDD